MMEIRGLAYVVAESSDLDRWVSYARDVLGMMPSTTADGHGHGSAEREVVDSAAIGVDSHREATGESGEHLIHVSTMSARGP